MLSTKEYELLREMQRNEKHKRNYVKITTLLMLHLGESPEKISLCLGISPSTIDNYKRTYEASDLDFYLSDSYKAYQGKLSPADQETLRLELQDKLYHNTAQIRDYIQKKFGVSYTCPGLVPLLHRLGFSYKKTKLVPEKADLEAQQSFVHAFEILMDTLSEDEAVFFLDAVHPQHNTRSAYGWIARGQEKEIPSNSGRKHLNINGAINAQNPSELIYRTDERINAQSTWELYQQIQLLHSEKQTIYVICDNAKYYRNKELSEKLQNTNIKQVFLPPYSPNLNLIERLWKFVRKKVIDYKFYPSFDIFEQSILRFFNNISQYKEELESLISWNFHIPKDNTSFY